MDRRSRRGGKPQEPQRHFLPFISAWVPKGARDQLIPVPHRRQWVMHDSKKGIFKITACLSVGRFGKVIMCSRLINSAGAPHVPIDRMSADYGANDLPVGGGDEPPAPPGAADAMAS